MGEARRNPKIPRTSENSDGEVAGEIIPKTEKPKLTVLSGGKENRSEILAQQQHQDVAGMLEKFVNVAKSSGQWDSLQSAREEFKHIQNMALYVECNDKSKLKDAADKHEDIIYTDKKMKIDVEDKNTGDVVRAEFSLVVDARGDSKNYGKYKLVPANDDAERLTQ